jgi:hypothetical protein
MTAQRSTTAQRSAAQARDRAVTSTRVQDVDLVNLACGMLG